jgi:RND superfamily putative drug exporter
MKAFGLGLPLAVLLDATLIRGALLPATKKLTGAAAWWAPEWLRRIYRRFGLHEAGDVAPGTRVTGELVGSQSAP